MSEHICSLLLTLGIRSTYRGFYYLYYALLLCLQNEDYLLFVCKLLYTDVAKHFHTSSSNVEHCIRTAVTHCYYHGNRAFLCRIAGYTLTSKPTNSEFLDILYHYLRSQEDRRLSDNR